MLTQPFPRRAAAFTAGLALAAFGGPLAAQVTGVAGPVPPASASASTAAATPGAPITAVRLAPGEALKLDGTLAHPAWQRAPAHEGFVEKTPVDGGPPPQRTRVQVLFDERALWVGVTAFDSEPAQIRDVPVRRDGVNRTQDFIAVHVDPIGAKRSAQFFRVNAAGSLADGLHTASDDSEDFSPDFDWDAAVAPLPAAQGSGWTAVLRLPFASLRFAEGEQAWRMMVVRRIPRQQFHMVMSVPLPREAPSFIDRMQPLQGVALPAEHAFLTLRPSLTLRRERADGAGRNDVDASLDLKWRPRAELVVDATLNPDFSQVELDVPQLAGNSRFALSFPEKRPFFYESADLLKSPSEAFYTRSFTAPRTGLRGTWRGNVWSGSALAVDDRGGGFVLLPGAFGTGAVEQPASRTLAARAKREMPGVGAVGAWQAGALVAARRYENGGGENTVLGPDLNAPLGETWRVRAQWLHSRSTAFTAGGQAVDGDRVLVKLARNTDDTEATLLLDSASAGFRHDTGFVNQVGVHHAQGFFARNWFQAGPFNLFALNLQVDQVQDRASGQLVSQDVRPGLYLTGARNLEAWVELHPSSRVRVAAGRPLLDQRYVAAGIVVTPAPWFPLLDTHADIGRLADTVAERVRDGLRWSATAKLRPLRRLELEPSVSLGLLADGGQLMYRESVVQGLAVWHLDARQTLRAIVQRSALDRRAEPGPAGGLAVGEARGRDTAASLTWAWRQSAGTVLYVGASRSGSRFGAEPERRRSEGFVKLQVDVDEARGLIAR